MHFSPGIDVRPIASPLGFQYGRDIFGPQVENRSLDSIRQSLLDPDCTGPDPVYAIAMDVGRSIDRVKIIERNLLFGVVTYAAGRLGREPVRSQGHVHKRSPRNGWSTPEVYEVWDGNAVILMQQSDADDPGRCFAIEAGPGQVVIVPPGWAHATISADPNVPLTFGAWCDRNYGFVYEGVRSHGGLAWFAELETSGKIIWKRNPTYLERPLQVKEASDYAQLGLERGIPIYQQFNDDPDRFLFVAEPQRFESVWNNFLP